jgi:glycosyltransferase involved in cell wall biosynthesis
MKVIALLACKNEAWILPAYLSSVVPVVDEIVAVDDGSTDESRELVREAGGLVVDARPRDDWSGYLGNMREDLLRIGRERGGTHFVCLDADEALTTPARESIRDTLAELEPGHKLAMQWLALWKSSTRYRDDKSVWSNSFKDFAFADSEDQRFPGDWPHAGGRTLHVVGRTPGPNTDATWTRLAPEDGAVLHFQFVAWIRFQVKQAWYRCAELIRAPKDAFDINVTYAHAHDDPDARTRLVPAAWLRGLEIPPGIEALPPTWHWDEMLSWFGQYGIEFFEPLDIWHVSALRDRFVAEVGREPSPTVGLPFASRVRRGISAEWSALKARRG